jgi:hypothetical protein
MQYFTCDNRHIYIFSHQNKNKLIIKNSVLIGNLIEVVLEDINYEQVAGEPRYHTLHFILPKNENKN